MNENIKLKKNNKKSYQLTRVNYMTIKKIKFKQNIQ